MRHNSAVQERVHGLYMLLSSVRYIAQTLTSLPKLVHGMAAAANYALVIISSSNASTLYVSFRDDENSSVWVRLPVSSCVKTIVF